MCASVNRFFAAVLVLIWFLILLYAHACLHLNVLLLRVQDQWRSTVMCVCLSVCLSVRKDVSGTTRMAAIFTNFSVHVAYGYGSVLLRQGDEIPRGRGNFGVFLPIHNAL